MLKNSIRALVLYGAIAGGTAQAADHGDTPALITLGRHDARITDLHAFANGDNLVLILSTNPNIPTTATSYTFASDLKFRFHIDDKADVDFSDPTFAKFGGEIAKPEKIESEITIEVTFPGGTPHVTEEGLKGEPPMQVFTGLRDDPFIRGPRIGRNIGAIVLEFPLDAVSNHRGPILIWATSQVASFNSPIVEHAGRALRSQNLRDDAMNTMPPSLHATQLGQVPDVMIFDTRYAAAFPNGRALTDDVIDLLPDPPLQANDFPFPSENDKPFLATFPYLAAPH